MIRKIKLISLILIMTIAVAYIDHKISIFDMRFYSGKDDGLFVIFESIIFLITAFYAIMSKKYILLNTFIGFIVSIFGSIFTYLLIALSVGKYLENMLLIFHIITLLVCIKLFFIIEKLLNKNKKPIEKNN